MTKQVLQSSPSGKRLLVCVKQPIDTFATANVDVLAPPASINGRTLVDEDRVLLTAQTDPDENGIYGFIGGDLVKDFDWLNEEGQLVEVIHGTYAGRLLAFVNGAWISYNPTFSPTPLATVKVPVRALGDTNINLSSPGAIGGSGLFANARYLLNAQTISAENGTYVYNGSILTPAADFQNQIGDITSVTHGRYQNMTFRAISVTTVRTVAFNHLMRFAVIADVRAFSYLYLTKEPILIESSGSLYVWRSTANGGNVAFDTGDDSTNVIALTGFSDGAYVLVKGQSMYPPTAIGTGSSWVTLFTCSEPANNGDSVEVAYNVNGHYLTGVTASFVRGRGLVVTTRTGGASAIAATSSTFTDPRIRAIYVSGVLRIQAQQHATENWIFEAAVSQVRHIHA